LFITDDFEKAKVYNRQAEETSNVESDSTGTPSRIKKNKGFFFLMKQKVYPFI